jgi:hypothetical protein
VIQVVSKNIKGCLRKFSFIFSSNQIWLNLLVDQWHFGSNTKLTTQNKVHLQVMR